MQPNRVERIDKNRIYMSSTAKHNVSYFFLLTILLIGAIIILYDGVYYRNWVSLSKKAFRDTEVGQRFRAVILPDMLPHDHEFGITPRYIKIILSPLPEYEQNYAEELVRIQEMYGE